MRQIKGAKQGACTTLDNKDMYCKQSKAGGRRPRGRACARLVIADFGCEVVPDVALVKLIRDLQRAMNNMS